MNAIKATNHIAINHIDHRLSNRLVDFFEGIHALLNNHITNLKALFNNTHLVAFAAIEVFELACIVHHHYTHAIGASIGLHNNIRLFFNAIFTVFFSRLF